jgi:hypothetical protein
MSTEDEKTDVQRHMESSLEMLESMKVPKNVLITKIKFTGSPKQMMIQYLITSEEAPAHTHTVETKELPHPDFINALNAMNTHFQLMCEQWNIDGDEAACQVLGASIKHNMDHELSVTLTGARMLDNSNAPLIINSPSQKEYSPVEEELMTQACLNDLLVLMAEAWKFVDGKRKQASLFDADANGEVEENGEEIVAEEAEGLEVVD